MPVPERLVYCCFGPSLWHLLQLSGTQGQEVKQDVERHTGGVFNLYALDL